MDGWMVGLGAPQAMFVSTCVFCHSPGHGPLGPREALKRAQALKQALKKAKALDRP